MNGKIKRNLLCVLSAAAVAASTASAAFADSSAADENAASGDNGQMRDITAMEISKEMGLGLNLGNTMEAYWLDRSKEDTGAQTIGENLTSNYETCWGAVVTTQEMIDGMKEAGFNTVRVPVYWGNMMENDGTFTINEDYIARVKEIVDYCRNDGLYVVINCHHYDEFLIRRYTKTDDLEGCKEAFTTVWTQIAEYFKDYSDYLIFEGFNEYLGGGPLAEDGETVINLPADKAYEWTNALNQTFVDAVRATGGNNAERVLIASGYWTNIDNTTDERFVMPTDTAENKMMVSVHYVDNAMYWTNNIGTADWKAYSIDQCDKLKTAFYDKGIPVFVGETTSRYDANRFGRDAEIKKSSEALNYMLRLITGYGYTPVLWDTYGGFYDRDNAKISGSTDAEVISILSQELAGTLPPSDWTPTDSNVDSTADSSVSSSESTVNSDSDSSAADSTDSAAVSSAASSAASTSKAAGGTTSTSAGKTDNPATGSAAAAAAVLLLCAGAVVAAKKR